MSRYPRLKFVFSTKGLILLNMAILSIIPAIFGTLSGPLKEWGVGDFVVDVLGMVLLPEQREGRIIILYHTIAMAFTTLLVYLITDKVAMKEKYVSNARVSITVGYLLTTFFGLGFAYWGHNWAFHGLFLVGQSLIFYAGCVFAVGFWPWDKDFYEKTNDYSKLKSGFPLERAAFFTMAVAMLGSAIFGAVAGAHWGHGHETFLAEDGVRHVHHTKLQLAVIGHLHIMLTLLGIAATLLIGRWFDFKGILHKIAMPLFIIGTFILTLGVWLVVPYQLYAHIIIYVGAVFAMSGALMLVIFGWGKLIKEGNKGIKKPGILRSIRSLLSDPLKFGPLWQMVFMNFTVSGVGIFMAIKLEKIFRIIPAREERILLTGHWHILSVLTATIVLMYITSEIFPIKGVMRKVFGWSVILGSDLAFAMITIFGLKRLWVTEEAQQPLVDITMYLSEVGMGVVLVALGSYMLARLVDFISKKSIKENGHE